MRVYHFSECPYPDAWSHADREAIRVTFPNKYCDAKVASDLINHRLDEWMLADELGLDIMINEHRSTTTCITASCVPPVAILARQTKKARLLVLGPTIGMRRDPIGLAEELSWIDTVSRGRLEIGLLKGYSAEIAPSNMNPASLNARYAEARDLVLKAMSHRDGPFNWEGEFFHYRQVNIWPRPYQDPHPPVWVSCFSAGSAVEVADRGYVCAGAGSLDPKMTVDIFSTYRRRCAELGRPNPPLDRFAYMCLVGVGRTEQEGLDRLGKVRGWVWSSGVTPEQFGNPPGVMPIAANVQMMKRYPEKWSWATHAVDRSGKPYNPSFDPPQALTGSGMGFGGTPDQVFEQLKNFYYYVGGFGNLLAMMHGGDLSHTETEDSMKLFAHEVLPRLRELKKPEPVDFTGEIAKARA
jgi:alkanesulfonate monooxygenase SsuD/methylene tetrahydromethanopterin reductase-like flavin-dependent oxidoreductase (luciferase family)